MAPISPVRKLGSKEMKTCQGQEKGFKARLPGGRAASLGKALVGEGPAQRPSHPARGAGIGHRHSRKGRMGRARASGEQGLPPGAGLGGPEDQLVTQRSR